MLETDIAAIKRKSVVGVMALTTRTFILGIIGLVSNQIILPILLSPDIFGIYFVVTAVIAFLGYFSDIGLAASLVQKKEQPSRQDLRTTFTIQQFLVGTLVVGSLLFSHSIAAFYGLGTEGTWLLRALVVSFFLSSLKTIPSILLERELAFDRLVVPTFIESVAFYGTVIALAWRGMGVTSFSIAVLVRAVTGTAAIYLIRPWGIGFGFSADSARNLLRFGIPFQMNSFLALLKDDLMTLFLGRILTFTEVGYIGWAKKWAEVPLRLFMDNIIRITFPAFARMQHDKAVLGRAIEKTIYGLAITTFPVYVGLVFFIRELVYMIPKYVRYADALPSFYIFALASVIACLNTPLTNALQATGNVRITLYFMILYVVLTWILTLIFIPVLGFHGFAVAMVIISLTIVVMVYVVKKHLPFSFTPNVSGALIAAAAQSAWYGLVLPFAGGTYFLLSAAALSGGILYAGVLYMIEKNKLMQFLTLLRKRNI